MKFLQRENAPLSEEQWKALDDVVIKAAKSYLVGRRFIEITSALDPGIQFLAQDTISSVQDGACGLFGDKECGVVKIKDRKFLPIPQIYKDFKIHWRDIESAKKLGIPVDFSVASVAAREVAMAEDNFIFKGDKSIGYEGILNVEGKEIVKKENFDGTGNIFKTALRCVEVLAKNGFSSNLAFIMHPKDYIKAFRIYENSGVLEIDYLKNLFEVGIFSTYAIEEGKAVAIATGAENMDLFIAQDMITAYLKPQDMDHYFRMFELVGFRIKNPLSIALAE